MSATQFAYGYARIRARKARLWTRDDALVALARRGRAAEPVDQPYDALAADYAVTSQGYPAARTLLTALWRRHEIENLKLAWRARAFGLPPARWRSCWRRLGALETITIEMVERSTSLASFVRAIHATPYGPMAAAVRDAHEGDPLAAELAFERWTYAAIVRAASALPAREASAAALVRDVVRERDLQRVRRAGGAYGLAPGLATSLTVQLIHDMRPAAIEALAAWRPSDGPLGARLPHDFVNGARVDDWDALIIALRSGRRRACVRAFMGPPFVIAPAVAFLLLREAEIEGRLAIVSGHAAQAAVALERTFAAGLMGT